MAPIRIGLIGLSPSARTAWASKSHLPYLLSAAGREEYTITALCNSSAESAQRAIEAYSLPPSTRAYGDASALAADAEVDLVVCNVRVDRHAALVRPALEAGKAVFCEWPLAADALEVAGLVRLAAERGVRTLVGTQGRVSPVTRRVRRLLEEGRVGRILSAEVRVSGGTVDREVLRDNVDYFTDLKVGGNMVTINVGHVLDTVQSAMGQFSDVKPTLQLQRPDVPVISAATGEPVTVARSDVPDLVIFTGTLAASATARDGATVLFRFRRGQPFKGEPPFVWTINGEKGEIRVTAQGALHAPFTDVPPVIEVHDHTTDEVDLVNDWTWSPSLADLPITGRNTGALYHNFATGAPYPTFKDAQALHSTIDTILAGWKPENSRH